MSEYLRLAVGTLVVLVPGWLVARGRLHRGERGRLYREAAAWLGSGDVETLLSG